MQGLQNESVVVNQIVQSERPFPSTSSTYDLAIVGSGISCAYTLIHYLDLLAKKLATREIEEQKTIKVAVLDKSGEFWKGIPYGSRSGQQSLIITSLREFLPQPERDRFTDWLKANYNSVISSLQKRPGIFSSQWLKSYQAAIEQNHWNDLFIPRYLFGWYLKERTVNLLKKAAAQNYLQYELIKANVCNIQKQSEVYQIDTTEHNPLYATKVVLAIGSPPNKTAFLSQLKFFERSPAEAKNEVCCIADVYEPSQNSNIERILQHLQANSRRAKQVLIIGSNASALETIYSLNNLLEVAQLIDKFVVVSPSGTFPHPIKDTPVSTTYIAQNLDLLLQQDNFTAKQIYEAVQQDVAAALANNETVDGTYRLISQKVIQALDQLSYLEQKQFVIEYGVKIGKFQRRAGLDYLNVVGKLVLEGRLEFVKGKFISIISLTKNQFGFEYIPLNSSQPETFTTPVQVIINCAGFQDLTQSSSPLINNLIQQGICTPNDSRGGFEMNENFETQPNFYLMGPLVAGNINDKLRVWHAESCGRIFNLSQSLAEVLL
ncbi:hypothetical protein C7B62_15300 [Pleurocapsa sp. CCALA 161]|uniref:FAD/NAD(P)-binding protein n=1 Tax=Pleurocapsa sp. CCALA 161 TaxID=2107688 RepID=UPI000D0493EB|nr:FAD/NAD(P)-binding protein [Pleurocapsa sp. CCALA 161]PSB08867.1 hypothetical protein C7B62_15300 [Pleurocapsa sp. CCALA 161]